MQSGKTSALLSTDTPTTDSAADDLASIATGLRDPENDINLNATSTLSKSLITLGEFTYTKCHVQHRK